jgi:DNA-binding transcriptional regulator YdaS (Cro superfamily)
MDKELSPIQRACAHELVGNPSRLAKTLGVTGPTVYQWIDGSRPIPSRWCIPIEQATGGAVTRYDLRPDVFGEAPAPSKTEAA